jgi:hypothetical protein
MNGPCEQAHIGPGEARCVPGVREISRNMNRPACVVTCGTDLGGDGMTCPGITVCDDLVNNTTLMPPADGNDDVCAEP